MTVWMVRAGSAGEREELALTNGIATIGWAEMPDLTSFPDREHLADHYWSLHPLDRSQRIANQAAQLWAFATAIVPGDLVALPLKTQRRAIALGEVTGSYAYRHDLPREGRHAIPVRWLEDPLPREMFDQDLLYSLGAILTVCRIRRNHAEARIRLMFDAAAALSVDVTS